MGPISATSPPWHMGPIYGQPYQLTCGSHHSARHVGPTIQPDEGSHHARLTCGFHPGRLTYGSRPASLMGGSCPASLTCGSHHVGPTSGSPGPQTLVLIDMVTSLHREQFRQTCNGWKCVVAMVPQKFLYGTCSSSGTLPPARAS
jgi:hypothetical protein